MSSTIEDEKEPTSRNPEKTSRIPWKEYLKTQFYKILGFLFMALLIVGVMVASRDIENFAVLDFRMIPQEPTFLVAMVLSSICFFLVLLGFSKIVLVDMAEEFGLRDPESGRIEYRSSKFFLFAALALSFCSCCYLLLDVFLQEAYLQLLPVWAMTWILVRINADIPGLTDLSDPREYYQTIRNIYFDFFFIIIIAFSVIVFLAILTALGRRRVASRIRKEETPQEEETETRTLYKILFWLLIPLFIAYAQYLTTSVTNPEVKLVGNIASLLTIPLFLWWFFQLLKTIFLILWRSIKLTAFVTSVNALLIIPLIGVLYFAPVILWSGWDVFEQVQAGAIPFVGVELIQAFISSLPLRAVDILSIIQLDFVIITVIATMIVGFAEGFAILAIASAMYRGVEIARTGHIIASSPPRVVVFSKYLVLLFFWLGILWNSLAGTLELLIERLLLFPIDIRLPPFFFYIYNEVILSLSEWLTSILPSFEFIPLLLVPLYFITAGIFKFLSVTIITPRVKDRLSIFFLLVSTTFTLIVTNILSDLYTIQEAPGFIGYQDAPFRLVQGILTSAMSIFKYVESITFFAGFLFGIFWVLRTIAQKRRKKPEIIKEEIFTPS
ncbi:MAG: hypothetical protein ACFFE8_10110 [Candidatus Heimdallarchaeota archaeon]